MTSPVAGRVGPIRHILKWMREQHAQGRHAVGPCIRALMKHGLPKESAARMCAKDMDRALGTTKWRGGKK